MADIPKVGLAWCGTSDRDWPEDAAHENGNYFCTCCHCGHRFTGHKRRVSCKLCASIGDTPAPQSTEGACGVKGTPAPSQLLTPRAWQIEAMTRAAKLTGSPEGALALVEAKRYGLMADELERIAAGVEPSADPKVTAALDTLGKLGALEPDPTYGVKEDDRG